MAKKKLLEEEIGRLRRRLTEIDEHMGVMTYRVGLEEKRSGELQLALNKLSSSISEFTKAVVENGRRTDSDLSSLAERIKNLEGK